MSESLTAINQLKQQMQLSVLGQEHVVNSLIIAMLANGNVLLEGLPGTAKTRSIKTMPDRQRTPRQGFLSAQRCAYHLRDQL